MGVWVPWKTFWQLAAQLSALINLCLLRGHCSVDNPKTLTLLLEEVKTVQKFTTAETLCYRIKRQDVHA